MATTLAESDVTVEELSEKRHEVRKALIPLENGQYARFRVMLFAYFGEDVAGETSGATVSNLSATIAFFRGESAEDAKAYGFDMEKSELWAELHSALAEVGYADDNGPLADFSTTSIGPVIWLTLAYGLEVHGIDVEEALADHGADLIGDYYVWE